MLFVCNTLYHTLIALIYPCHEKQLLLDARIPKVGTLKSNIEKYTQNIVVNIFDDTVIYKDDTKLRYNQYDFDIKILNNRDIVLFNDLTYLGFLLNKNKIKYQLFEDGLDCFRSKLKKHIKLKTRIEFLVLGISSKMGMSRYCTAISVNDKTGLEKDIRFRKFIEMKKSELFDNISCEFRETLLKIFNVQAIKIPKNSALILTQPLYKDGFFGSLEHQVNFYSEKVEYYLSQNMNVFIKEHPRDTADYSIFNTKVHFLDKNVPMELLDFVIDNPFDIGYTHSSTALDALFKVTEKEYYIPINKKRDY